MKRGQTGIGLVILGVVAIIAVIGLVLLFTRAGKAEGALLTDLSIGNSYGSGNNPDIGISTLYQTEQFERGSGYAIPAVPQKSYPGYVSYPGGVIDTKGTRTPAMIISAKPSGDRKGYATITDLYGCEYGLIQGAKFGVPHDQLNCYQVPNKGGGIEVYGRYPPDSSAEARPPQSTPYGDYGNQGGDVYCYANSYGAEQQKPNSEDLVRLNILNAVKSGAANTDKYEWSSMLVNGKEVPVCWVSEKTFPFRQ